MAALLIIGVLFFISPPNKFGEPVKVSTLELGKNIAFQIRGAKLMGASEAGHRFDFKVDSIDPHLNNPKNFSLTNLNGELSIFEKDVYNILANHAVVNSTDGFIDLIGNLNIRTQSGVTGKSQKIRIDWSSSDVIVSSRVELSTPLGTVYGGKMKVSNASFSENENPYIKIENGVRLVFKTDSKPKDK